MVCEGETFTCEYCENVTELEDHILVPIPALEDTLSVCKDCVRKWGTEEFKNAHGLGEG